MDAIGKSSKTGEISMMENKSGEAVLTISEEEKDVNPRDATESADSYPENADSIQRPPKITNPEALIRQKTFARSIYSKPKSRFGEQPIDLNMFNDTPEPVGQTSARASPRVLPISPRTPLMASPGGDDNDEEIYKRVNERKQLDLKRLKMRELFQWALLLLLVGCIVASLTIHKLQKYMIWSLELWKWFVLITVISCGMIVTNWLIHFILLMIELNFLLRNKGLYFVHGLKKNAQVCIWLIAVLVTWTLLFNSQHIDRSKTATRVFDCLTWTIVALLVGSILWLLKTLLLKILPTSFHVNNFFDKIQDSIFHQYVLHTLSGPSYMESLQSGGMSTGKSQFSFLVNKKGKEAKINKGVLDISKLYQLKRETVSVWTMKILVDTILNSGLSAFSNELEERGYYGSGDEITDKEITNVHEAIAVAYHIFRNVAQPGFRYIDELDLRRFMVREEVDIVFPMIDVADKGQIDRRTLTEWVVKVYIARKELAYALDDTNTAVNEMNKLVTAVLIIIMIIVWLLLTEIATTKVLVFLSSQLVVAAFIFGNTCKTVFESIIFVFIMHPFDVGDRCVIDDVQMVVEKINILSTVLLKFDNEKIYYPNSVLATKTISNFNRSPDMGDNVEFYIDFATSFEKIGLLKDKIKRYFGNNLHLWYANHSIVVKEIENVNEIKMVLFFNHTMNFQDYGEKNKRRSELILELKRIFEELKIKCYLLQQEVNLPHLATPTPTEPTDTDTTRTPSIQRVRIKRNNESVFNFS